MILLIFLGNKAFLGTQTREFSNYIFPLLDFST